MTEEETFNGTWECSCGATKERGMVADPSWRWNGEGWEHRCPSNHPQAGHMRAEFIPSPKLKFQKFTHPKMGCSLISHEPTTREQVAEDYLGDDREPGDIDLFTVEEVEMAQEEFDALPEFEG